MEFLAVWQFLFLRGFPTPGVVSRRHLPIVADSASCPIIHNPQRLKIFFFSRIVVPSTGGSRDRPQSQFLFQTIKHEIKEIFVIATVPWVYCKVPPGNTYFLKKCCQGIILKQRNERVFCQNKAIHTWFRSLSFTLASLWCWRCARPWFKPSDNNSLYFKVTTDLVNIWNMSKPEWHLKSDFLFQLLCMALGLLSHIPAGLEEDGGRLSTIAMNSFTVPSFYCFLLFDLII